jgi:hypothetical protein
MAVRGRQGRCSPDRASCVPWLLVGLLGLVGAVEPPAAPAIDDGLRWLAAHQRRDGAWDRRHFDELCPEMDRCREAAVTMMKYDAEPAVTGLALLAFVEAGHTHERGEFRDQVTIGLDFLLSRQLESGSFAVVDPFEMYNHAIATLALAEAYGMSRDPSLKAPLTAAVRHIVRAQQPGGGWGYTSEVATRRDDMCVSGWVVMALASAKTAGVDVPDRTVLGIIDFVTDATYADGNVRYAREGDRIIDNATGATSRRFGPAPTAIAMLIRQLLGWQNDTPTLTRQSDILLGEPPDIDKFHGGDPSALHSAYYWYHGSLALFNQGGDAWRVWNEPLRTALLESQDRSVDARGVKKHSFGSFPAFGPGWGRWGRVGGKVYSTALGVLTLETSYGRVPAWLSGSGLITSSALKTGLSDPEPQRQTMLATVAARIHPDAGEPVLVDLLKHPEARLRLRAAVGLARHGSPLGEAVLRQALSGSQGGELAAIQAALAKIESLRWPERYGPVVRVDQEHGVMVFETGGEPVYIGQRIAVEHDGKSIAEARVTRRLSDHELAAAEIEDGPASKAIVVPGDTVILSK